jgi:hypothetical protein
LGGRLQPPAPSRSPAAALAARQARSKPGSARRAFATHERDIPACPAASVTFPDCANARRKALRLARLILALISFFPPVLRRDRACREPVSKDRPELVERLTYAQGRV